MTDDTVSATAVVDAATETVFGLLADPATHAAIDGTGWVQANLDTSRLSAVGQIFRMSMYHRGHPDGHYETVNQVETFDPPRAIAWKTGYEADDGTLHFGEWLWRYDLAELDAGRTSVTLTYDWSAVSDEARERIGFPPFGPEHLDNSLAHLAALAAPTRPR